MCRIEPPGRSTTRFVNGLRSLRVSSARAYCKTWSSARQLNPSGLPISIDLRAYHWVVWRALCWWISTISAIAINKIVQWRWKKGLRRSKSQWGCKPHPQTYETASSMPHGSQSIFTRSELTLACKCFEFDRSMTRRQWRSSSWCRCKNFLGSFCCLESGGLQVR